METGKLGGYLSPMSPSTAQILTSVSPVTVGIAPPPGGSQNASLAKYFSLLEILQLSKNLSVVWILEFMSHLQYIYLCGRIVVF